MDLVLNAINSRQPSSDASGIFTAKRFSSAGTDSQITGEVYGVNWRSNPFVWVFSWGFLQNDYTYDVISADDRKIERQAGRKRFE